MDGKKLKVAHKRAAKNKWNIKENAQRKKVIAFLENLIVDLKEEDEYISSYSLQGRKEILRAQASF